MTDPRSEARLLLALAAIQFVYVADFMVMSPLGPVLMRTFGIGPGEFGLLVSVYTFSAAAAGFLGALFVDRFDRRRVLLVLFGVYIAALLGAAFAPGYPTLLAARALGGAAGGLMGATVYTVIADRIPEARRGAATGMVMSAFSLATIAGVPIGLLFAGWFGWHAPFFFVAAMASVAWWNARRVLPPMNAHLSERDADVHPVKAAFWPVFAVLRNPNHLRAYAFVVLLMFSAFMVIPFISLYMTGTVGITETQLPLLYLVGGAATLVTSRLVGRWSDRIGRRRMYRLLAIASIVPLLLTTHLPPLPLWWAVAASTLFFVIVPARMIPAIAIITSSAVPRLRGTFMSLNASVQSLSQAGAAYVGGAILVRTPDGRIEQYGTLGWLAVAATVAAIVWVEALQPGAEPRD
jgi:predicted MFS family arabinose efflux permease